MTIHCCFTSFSSVAWFHTILKLFFLLKSRAYFVVSFHFGIQAFFYVRVLYVEVSRHSVPAILSLWREHICWYWLGVYSAPSVIAHDIDIAIEEETLSDVQNIYRPSLYINHAGLQFFETFSCAEWIINVLFCKMQIQMCVGVCKKDVFVWTRR